jgi:electron transfer flavoprotein beta subunit
MRVLVPIKRVIDYNVRVRIDAAGKAVETENVKMSLNPFDETAVEEAVRLKAAGKADEIVVVAIGPAAAMETIRTALAMGADRGFLVEAETAPEPLAVAKLLRAICGKERPDLVICGRQAIDDDAAQVGPMLAMLLGWPQGAGASKLAIEAGAAIVQCETDAGKTTLRLPLPAVISADLRLNTPRYVTLPGIMRARKKTVGIVPAADFGIDLSPRLEAISLREPAQRQAGVRAATVAAFLDLLPHTGEGA